MARLIDADELIEVLNEHGYSTDDYEDDSYDMGVVVGFNNGLIHARHHVHYAPTIDAEPVRHGHWINRRNSVYCSRCGKGYRNGVGTISALNHNYCPNCGAKMDEVSE